MGELEKLIARDKYHGHDQVHTANIVGMRISQIDKSFVSTLKCNLVLNNVLYISEASKKLVSVHRLTSDNHAFIEYHPDCFMIKDRQQGKHCLGGGVKVACIR